MGSLKSAPLNSSASSWASALRAITMLSVSRAGLGRRLSGQLTFESLLHVHCLLGTGLEIRDVAPRLAVGHSAFRRNHPFAFLYIDLVSQYHLQPSQRTVPKLHKNRYMTHKRKALGISRGRLDEEFVAPAIQRLETLRVVDIVDQNAAISTSIESDTQRLKPFLACSIPDLELG